MAKICLCLTAKTIDRNLEILNKYKKYTDIAELRVDCLDPNERLYIRRFPELAGLPVILTVRRDIDGGFFTGGEGARVKLFASGLAYAKADSRLNFAYIDIEDDLNVPSLEEAARTFGTKIIRSYHNMEGIIDDIPKKIKTMQRYGDEIVKVAVKTNTTKDVLAVYRASKLSHAKNKIIICMGHLGLYSRILAEKFGSGISYANALSEHDINPAPGQLDVKELSEMYRFKKITKKTKVFGVVGYPLKASISPWFLNSIFALENTDSVYVPFPTDSIKDFMELAGEMEAHGLSITVPYKESVLNSLAKATPVVQKVGACNTVFKQANPASASGIASGWIGGNTDCAGFSDSLLTFMERNNFKHQKITIIGAGGAARAVAAEVHRLGGKALVLNRTIKKARELASLYNFRYAGLDNNGISLMSKYSDILIQTTSVGMAGYEQADPVELYNFTGKEIAMDLIYTPIQTPFLKRAASCGCKILNGYNMVIRQACLQYENYFGKPIPNQILSKIKTTGEDTWNKIRTG